MVKTLTVSEELIQRKCNFIVYLLLFAICGKNNEKTRNGCGLALQRIVDRGSATLAAIFYDSSR
jgi:hypothetical protein